MNKIYLLGDTHGNWFNIRQVAHASNDTIIVLGDFGFIWDRTTKSKIDTLQKEMARKNNMLLFLDGNHENFEMLNAYPIEDWNGGKVHKIAANILHLMRGQMFTIEGKTFFVMGGAASIDFAQRQNRVSWWEEENITNTQMDVANATLQKNNDKTDYVLTHTCPQSIAALIYKDSHFSFYDSNTRLLQSIYEVIDFKHWYFGHMHEDRTIGRFTCVYIHVIELN